MGRSRLARPLSRLDDTTGRTAIIITHRFSPVKYADIIHVMDVGQIVESGSHQELLALGGRYAESWRAQMNGKFMAFG